VHGHGDAVRTARTRCVLHVERLRAQASVMWRHGCGLQHAHGGRTLWTGRMHVGRRPMLGNAARLLDVADAGPVHWRGMHLRREHVRRHTGCL
jgi:hypothetical protein